MLSDGATFHTKQEIRENGVPDFSGKRATFFFTFPGYRQADLVAEATVERVDGMRVLLNETDMTWATVSGPGRLIAKTSASPGIAMDWESFVGVSIREI